MKVEPNGIPLNESGWTLSLWCKNLLPPSQTGQSTLFRGQDKQNETEFDHYLVLRGSDQLLGFIDGDETATDQQFRSSGYSLDPFQRRDWFHLAVMGEGEKTKFFVNGIFVGQTNRRDQSDVYYIGNSSGDEVFAEFMDDVRIYKASLSHSEIGAIYGGGFGDMFASIQAEENSTSGDDPRIFDFTIGKDSKTLALTGLNSELNVTHGQIDSFTASENNQSYRLSVHPDTERTLHGLTLPTRPPIRFESLSLWLDASDTQGGTYTAQSSNELTLWLDASDGGSVTKDPSTGELISWQNKINPAVEMKSWNYKPTFIDSNLSGRTGLRLYSEQGRRQGFTAYQNGRGWNPAGEKGATSGAIEDVVVMLIWRIEEFTRTSFPFNFGWGDHFPWENGHIYWRFSDNRKSVWVGNTGIPLLTTLEFSVTKGQQVVYRNGSNVLSGPRTDVRYISGSFFFPGNGGGSDYNPRFTLGEMIVLRGTMTDQEREVHEGYLAHKWGIGNTLSSSHSYRNSRPSTFDGENWEPSDSMAKLYWLDKSNQRNHATAYGSPSLDQNTQNGLNL